MDILKSLMSDIQFNLKIFLVDMLVPCLLAVIFGGIIGYQRERSERPAGLRTHALVCLGSTVFTLISSYGFSSQNGFDPTRIAAGVVTGIGFIGAGVIFRQGPLVKGVTTAASIWTVASIGLAIGSKLYYLAIIVTILGFFTLSLLKFFHEKSMREPLQRLIIEAKGDFDETDHIITFLENESYKLKNNKYEYNVEKNIKYFTVDLIIKDPDFQSKALKYLSSLKGVLKVDLISDYE